MQEEIDNKDKNRILIVQSSLILNEVVKAKLERSNLETIFFGEANRALEYLQSEQPLPNAILVEYSLESMSIYDFLEKISLNEKFSKIPVIVVGEAITNDEKQKIKKSGAAEYLTRQKHRIGDIVHIIVAIIEKWSE